MFTIDKFIHSGVFQKIYCLESYSPFALLVPFLLYADTDACGESFRKDTHCLRNGDVALAVEEQTVRRVYTLSRCKT